MDFLRDVKTGPWIHACGTTIRAWCGQTIGKQQRKLKVASPRTAIRAWCGQAFRPKRSCFASRRFSSFGACWWRVTPPSPLKMGDHDFIPFKDGQRVSWLQTWPYHLYTCGVNTGLVHRAPISVILNVVRSAARFQAAQLKQNCLLESYVSSWSSLWKAPPPDTHTSQLLPTDSRPDCFYVRWSPAVVWLLRECGSLLWISVCVLMLWQDPATKWLVLGCDPLSLVWNRPCLFDFRWDVSSPIFFRYVQWHSNKMEPSDHEQEQNLRTSNMNSVAESPKTPVLQVFKSGVSVNKQDCSSV